MWPLVIAGLAIAALVAVSSSKQTVSTSGGQTWHYVIGVHPDIPEIQQDQITTGFDYMFQGAKVESVTFQPNTIDLIVRYSSPPKQEFTIGSSMTVGPYEMVLTEKDRVS